MKQISHGGDLLATAVQTAYADGQLDYGLEPLVRTDAEGNPVGTIKDGDAVIFCCRRGEREIELTEAFTDPAFDRFDRRGNPKTDFVILTMYHDKFKDLPIAFAPSKVQMTLGEVLARAGKSQLHCAESEKFAHVTFFFNGGNNKPFPGENDLRIPSPKGIPFDTVPEMSLPAVAEAVKDGLRQGYDFIVTNFANGDVIGHTANDAAKIACASAVDRHLGDVVAYAKAQNYLIAITADHGNLEVMRTSEGKPHVAHTSNLVNFLLIDPSTSSPIPLNDGCLGDIAPTLLALYGLQKPDEMTGCTLLSTPRSFGENRKVLLMILDGWGEGKQDNTNPIAIAETPNWDRLLKEANRCMLRASGESVGLQEGKAGNSEAGHINIGSGRVVPQDDVRLDQAMKDGSFSRNQVFLQTIDAVEKRGGSLHLFALLTKKSSHGSIDYPLALMEMGKRLPHVYVHVIFDGRSTEPGSAPALLRELDAQIEAMGSNAQIVSGVGRGVALDRDGNYAKIQRAYDSLVHGVGRLYA